MFGGNQSSNPFLGRVKVLIRRPLPTARGARQRRGARSKLQVPETRGQETREQFGSLDKQFGAIYLLVRNVKQWQLHRPGPPPPSGAWGFGVSKLAFFVKEA